MKGALLTSEQDIRAATFKYRHSYPTAAVGSLFVSSMAALGGFLIARDKYDGDLFGGAILLLFFVPLGLLLINVIYGFSDVSIDETGIFRHIFGKQLQYIPWQNVQKIRLLIAPTFSLQGPATTFSIDQTEVPRSYFRRAGGMFFNEQVDDIDLLIKILNYYIQKYKIPVCSGYKTKQIQLDTIRLKDLFRHRDMS
jgi:hypothetical protein